MPRNLATSTVRLALVLVCLTLAPIDVRAQEQTTQQQEHVVRTGDTLWDLARMYLDDPFQWRLIFDANRDVVENAHWIYPAERLIIPPILQSARTEPLGVPPAVPVFTPMPVHEVVPEPEDTTPTVIAAVDLRRPVVPIAEYRAAPWLSSSPERQVVGRIARMADPAAVADQLAPALHPNDRVHVTVQGARTGDSLLVVRFGRTVSGRGRIVEPLGVLRVDSVNGGVATAHVARQFGEAQVGDVVIPLPTAPEIALGEPEPVDGGPEAQLLQFVEDEPLHGTTDVGFISIGREAGVGIGDEFAIYVVSRDEESAAPAVPTQVGTLRVVRVGDGSSTVRVTAVSSVALRNGLPVRLVARMQ